MSFVLWIFLLHSGFCIVESHQQFSYFSTQAHIIIHHHNGKAFTIHYYVGIGDIQQDLSQN